MFRSDHFADDSQVRDLLLVALTVSTGAVDAISWLALGDHGIRHRAHGIR
jgi:hypothetical protein